jgi:hypothetical protein
MEECTGLASGGMAAAIRAGTGDGGGDDFDFDVHGGIHADALEARGLEPVDGAAKSAKFVNDLRVVYEIQTRLQPETQPQSAPAVPPQNPSPANPQDRSQTSPHPGHSQSRTGVMLASLM